MPGFTPSDTRHGFAFPAFTNRSTLSFTEDGGRDWTQVPIPRGHLTSGNHFMLQ
jgi:hypothetical protein